MSSASFGMKHSFINLSFHLPLSSIKLHALAPCIPSEMARSRQSPCLSSQGSWSNTICLPSPTFHLYPLINSSLPYTMLFHVREGLGPIGALIKSLSLKFFPLRMVANRLSGFLRIRTVPQHCGMVLSLIKRKLSGFVMKGLKLLLGHWTK